MRFTPLFPVVEVRQDASRARRDSGSGLG